MNNSLLIQAAQNGDLEAFNQLILQNQDFLFGIAVRLLGDDDDAADALQDALLLVFRKLTTFRGGSLRSWLARILVNVCYDRLRDQKRRRTIPLEPLDDNGESVEEAPWLADPTDGPEDIFDMGLTRDAIQAGLERLTPVYQTILVLVDIEGFTYDETAAALCIPVGTVKSRLARARMQMMQALQPYSECMPGVFQTRLLELRVS